MPRALRRQNSENKVEQWELIALLKGCCRSFGACILKKRRHCFFGGGTVPTPSTPEEFGLIRDEMKKWGEVVKAAKIAAD